jgi:hypothetical protein
MVKKLCYKNVCRNTWKDKGGKAMDFMLLFLILGGHVILLWLGIPLWWALCMVIIFGLIYLGLRYPRGKQDWRYSFTETFYMLMTLITMLIFIMAIQAALVSIGGNIPSAITILTLFIVMPVMMVLFLLGLFFPIGKRIHLRRTQNMGKT